MRVEKEGGCTIMLSLISIFLLRINFFFSLKKKKEKKTTEIFLILRRVSNLCKDLFLWSRKNQKKKRNITK